MLKKIAALAVAGSLAVGSVAATSAPANAQGIGIGAAALLGLGIGAAFGAPAWGWNGPYYGYAPPPPRYLPPRYASPPPIFVPPMRGNLYGRWNGGGWSQHVSWCSNRWRTYMPATNTYYIRRGVQAVCHSPFG